MKYIVSILVLLICFSSNAQQTGSLAVYGKIKYKKTILNEVRIEVYKDNELQQEIVNLRNGSFKLNLKIGSKPPYQGRFPKPYRSLQNPIDPLFFERYLNR